MEEDTAVLQQPKEISQEHRNDESVETPPTKIVGNQTQLSSQQLSFMDTFLYLPGLLDGSD